MLESVILLLKPNLGTLSLKKCSTRKIRFISAFLLIVCCSLHSRINTLYGQQLLDLCRPVEAQYSISQPFGPSSDERLQEFYKKEGGYEGHPGIDFACPVGTSVFACDDGRILEINDRNPNDVNGLFVRISHAWGISFYGHLNRIMVKNGQDVKRCSPIGYSGKTGFVTNPHLHFGMIIRGIPNPGYTKNPYGDYVDPLRHTAFIEPLHMAAIPMPPTTSPTAPPSVELAKPPTTYSDETIPLRNKIEFYKKKIQSINSRLLGAIPNPPIITFNLSASQEVTVLTDGRITTGLMEFLYDTPTDSSDDQLAIVLAHTIAHRKLETETLSKMLESGLKSERKNMDKNMAIFDSVFSIIKFFVPMPPIVEITKSGGKEIGKAFFNQYVGKTLEDFQRDRENAAHYFGALYTRNAGFDVKKGLQIFEKSVEFSKQHPINKNFWQDYTREVQAQVEQERLPTKRTFEDGLIKLADYHRIYLLFGGKRYLVPDRATLESLNFEKLGVRELSSSVFYSIPEGDAEEAKGVFALWKRILGEETNEQKKPVDTDTSRKARVWVPEHIEGDYTIEGHYEGGGYYRQRTGELTWVSPDGSWQEHEEKEKSAKNSFKIPEVYKKDRNTTSEEVPYITPYLPQRDGLLLPPRISIPGYNFNSIDDVINSLDYLIDYTMDTSPDVVALDLLVGPKQAASMRQGMKSYFKRLETNRLLRLKERYGNSLERAPKYYGGYNYSPYLAPLVPANKQNEGKPYAHGLKELLKNSGKSPLGSDNQSKGIIEILQRFREWDENYLVRLKEAIRSSGGHGITEKDVREWNLKSNGDKVLADMKRASETSDMEGFEKSLEEYKDLMELQLKIIEAQKD